jgi:putative transposase
MNVINQFTKSDNIEKQNNKRNNNITLTLKAVGMSKSSYYYKNKKGKVGRKTSSFSMTNTGDLVTDKDIIKMMNDLLEHEFVDYGYIKVTHYLKQQGIRINKKKVYRLMKENKLLKNVVIKPSFKRDFVKFRKIKPKKPFEYLETDIKYFYVPSERINVYLLTILDVFSRKVVGYKLAKSIRKHDVIDLFNKIFTNCTDLTGVTLRNDNGSQFIANEVRDFLRSKNIYQEFTHVSTPQENAHIEAYHSIIEREFMYKFDYYSFDELTDYIERYCKFYNEERLHSSIDFKSPNNFLLDYLKNIENNDYLKLTLLTNFIKL